MNHPYANTDYGLDEVGAKTIGELNDVTISDLANDQIIKYNSSTGLWGNSNLPSGSATTLSGLDDTTFESLANGEIIKYNSTSGKWENFPLTLNELTDVTISSIADNQILRYNSTSSVFENTFILINEINDINITSIGDNEVLKYNSSSGNWENEPARLAECGDVNFTSLANNQVLKYNSSSGKWENAERIDSVDELGDVTITEQLNNQVLKYSTSSSKYVNAFLNLTELADINLESLTNDNILRYDSSTGKWLGEALTLNSSDDVNITSIANSQILQYNSTSGKWENANQQTITLAQAGATVVSGSFPNFVISSTDTDTVFTAGSNMSLIGTEFNIPQSVEVNATPAFEKLSLGGSGTNQGILELKDFESGVGYTLISQIKGVLDGTNGGKLTLSTKVDGGSLTDRLTIEQNGAIALAGNTSVTGSITASTTLTCTDITCEDITSSGTIQTSSGTMNASLMLCGRLHVNASSASPATNDAIMFSHGRILSQSGSGTNIMLESYTGYLVLKSGNHISLEAGGSLFSNKSLTVVSDDRLKWQEQNITNGLSVINKLKPQVYWRGKELDVEPSEEERVRESGFIAQEVEAIPELQHAVKINKDGVYSLNYNELTAYYVSAIQELHKLVKSLQHRVNVLEGGE